MLLRKVEKLGERTVCQHQTWRHSTLKAVLSPAPAHSKAGGFPPIRGQTMVVTLQDRELGQNGFPTAPASGKVCHLSRSRAAERCGVRSALPPYKGRVTRRQVVVTCRRRLRRCRGPPPDSICGPADQSGRSSAAGPCMVIRPAAARSGSGGGTGLEDRLQHRGRPSTGCISGQLRGELTGSGLNERRGGLRLQLRLDIAHDVIVFQEMHHQSGRGVTGVQYLAVG